MHLNGILIILDLFFCWVLKKNRSEMIVIYYPKDHGFPLPMVSGLFEPVGAVGVLAGAQKSQAFEWEIGS